MALQAKCSTPGINVPIPPVMDVITYTGADLVPDHARGCEPFSACPSPAEVRRAVLSSSAFSDSGGARARTRNRLVPRFPLEEEIISFHESPDTLDIPESGSGVSGRLGGGRGLRARYAKWSTRAEARLIRAQALNASGLLSSISNRSVRVSRRRGIGGMRFFRREKSARTPLARTAVPRFSFPSFSVPVRSLQDASCVPLCAALACALLFVLMVLCIPWAVHVTGGRRLALVRFETDSTLAHALRRGVFRAEEVETREGGANAAALAEALDTQLATVSYRTYTVRKGDTISAIALRAGLKHMGTLLSVNGISNARRLSVGDQITIPSMDGLMHTVQKGQSLSAIASLFRLPLNTLLDANDLVSRALTVGQRLFIPGAKLSAFDLRKVLGELFMYPIRGRRTSGFGYRSDPFSGKRSFHNGIDLAAPYGTQVKATLDGKVAEIGYSRIYGNYLIIVHGGGYQTMYGHLSSVMVGRGARVVQGTTIGRVGASGRATGPHLHFSVFKNGSVVNPLKILTK